MGCGRMETKQKGTIEYYNYITSVSDSINIRFVKVRGHSGVEGNEEADRLAKRAVGLCQVQTSGQTRLHNNKH